MGSVVALAIGSSLMRNHHEERFRIVGRDGSITDVPDPELSIQLFYISAGIYAVSALICQFCYNPPRLPTQVGAVGERLGYVSSAHRNV